MIGKLKERKETEFILVKYTKNLEPMDDKEMLLKSRQAGYLFYPFHYSIDDDGIVHKLRTEESVSNGEVDDNEVTISILSSQTDKALSSLEYILNALQEVYKGATVKYEH